VIERVGAPSVGFEICTKAPFLSGGVDFIISITNLVSGF